MLQKLFYIDDIFKYIAEYLNFNQKLVLQKIFKKCLTKNCDFFSDSYKLHNMASLCSICSSCHGDISYDVKSILSSNYDNFLYGGNDGSEGGDSGNESDSESEDYKLIFSGNRREYSNNYDVEENLFVYLSFPYVANRAFFEVLEKNNMALDCKIHEIKCIFELELKDEMYEEIYTTIDDIYIDGIVNGCIDKFCYKCGIFGHIDESKECLLYNEEYKEHITEHTVFDVMDNLLQNVVEKVELERKQEEQKKRLCSCCGSRFFAIKCKNKLCRKCCNCKNHPRKKR